MIESLADKLAPPFVYKPFHSDQPLNNETDVSWEGFSVQEVAQAIKELKPKAAGLDKIRASMLKELPPQVIIFLQSIFVELVRLSRVPQSWCSIKLIAILKPGKDGSQVSHFRPIAILSTIRKVFERLVLVRLESWTTRVTFDTKCLWGAHIRLIVESCNKRINFLRAICGTKWGSHPAVLKTLYLTTVRSVIEYGSILFRRAAKSHLIKLNRLQWRALRICFGLMCSTPTSALEVVAGVPPLELRFIFLAEKLLLKLTLRQPD
uniref:Uncharacterized protein n=1 Tax=Phlebotomus papatasi TaxID=29031 RepID=A0A1B0EZT7_PHLPP